LPPLFTRRASRGAVASGVEPWPGSVAPAVGASWEGILFLTTQVAEMGSRLEEALRDCRRLEEALKAARATLNTTDMEVEATRLSTDGAEACRVGMYLG
jgi:hypothetical protein